MPYLIALLVCASLMCGISAAFVVRRRGAVARAGAQFGFQVAEDVPVLCETPLFDHVVDSANVLVGKWDDCDATLFDLQGSSNYLTKSNTQTVAGFRKEGLNLPVFQLHTTDLGDRIARLFSHDVVDVSAPEEFGDRYTLRSINPLECLAFFTPEIIAFFATLPRHGLTIEGYGDTVILYRPGARVHPAKLSEFLQQTGDIASAFLACVRKRELASA